MSSCIPILWVIKPLSLLSSILVLSLWKQKKGPHQGWGGVLRQLSINQKCPFFVQHPDIAECCVLGLPDKDYGEAVSAIVVLESETKGKQEDSNSALSLEELCTWAKDKLAPYKVLQRHYLL